MHLKLALLLAGAAFALAAPATSTSSLQKRSFKASDPGRSLGRAAGRPLDEILRTHQKYNWAIVVSEDVTPSREPPRPFSSSATQVSLATVSTVGTVAPTGYGSPSAPYDMGNSTSTVSAGAASTSGATPGTEDGEVSANPEENEIEYLSPVSIGGQTLNLNFDTGSADL